MTTFATASAMSVTALLAALAARGEDPRALSAVLGADVDGPLEPTLRLGVQNVFSLWEYAAKVMPNHSVPVRVAASATLESSHLLGLLVMTAPTTRAALEAATTYGALHTDSGRWHLAEDSHHVTLRWERPLRLTPGHALCNEAILCHWLNGLRRATQGNVVPVRAWVRHAPRHSRELSEFVGCHVEAGEADDGFVLRRDFLDEPPRPSNAVLWQILKDAAERELARLRAPSLAERVRSELALAFERRSGDLPSAGSLAKRLGLSERSLRRRLDEAGIGFRDLVDEARRERATALLADPTRSMTEIAYDVGFSGPSAFTHAHRRWFGRPPSRRN
jgi:AraC-like DNA-binding protein